MPTPNPGQTLIPSLVSAVFEDLWVDLKGDYYADPTGNDPLFAAPLLVFYSHGGAPSDQDHRLVVHVRYLGTVAPDGEEDIGHTLIVAPGHGKQGILLYFPDGQHEIVLCDDDEDNLVEDEGGTF